MAIVMNDPAKPVMRRCFMTGKQCIFSSQIQDSEKDNAFAIMPMRPNFEAFYQWSLKPFLLEGCKIKNIQIADEVRDIGYIICEKICRKIQESDLVLVEISLPNPNVFYEFGLACGINRPVVLMKNKNDSYNTNNIKSTLSLPSCKGAFSFFNSSKIFYYEGVKPLSFSNGEEYFKDYITYFPRPPSNKKLNFKIQILSFRDENKMNKEEDNLDLNIEFKKLIIGAVAKAMAEIMNEILKKDELAGKKNHVEEGNAASELKPWEQFIKTMGSDWEEFTKAESIIDDTEVTTDKIIGKLEESFCTLIDITNNDPVAYFWLGYCHARGLNAIPINQIGRNKLDENRKNKLAFDIRALWYAECDRSDLINFKNQIREILEHLMERDLSDLHRRTFWERFPAETPLKVFVGAVHSPTHTREVVGDWDVRVVSDLFSYLPTVREATTIKLVAPLYSPEESYEKQKNKPKDDEFIKDFCGELDNHLENSNAIVIASPDVNALTEYLLYKIYNLEPSCKPLTKCPDAEFDGYIAVKRYEADNSNGKEKDYAKVFPRLFYKSESLRKGQKADRGFKPHSRTTGLKPIYEKYFRQGLISKNGFDLLGHLLIAKYPPNSGSKNWVVILNGVSGPATSALAEILTGGGLHASEPKRLKSEEMLKEINFALESTTGIGVEAIIKVHIGTPQPTIGTPQPARMTFADTREIESWDFLKGYGPKEIKPKTLKEEAIH